MQVGEALAQGTQAIHSCKISQTPLLDASLLLSAVTGLSREQLYTRSSSYLSGEAATVYRRLIDRRCQAQPVAYLTGVREFYGRTFTVDPSVLIPRSDTETLVQTVLDHLPNVASHRILDLCTGSGCVGITLAAEIPSAEVTLTDISDQALSVAQINAARLVDRPIELVCSDLFSSLDGRQFHVIATNPPYIADSWYEQLEVQVKQEPTLALLGGDQDGLAIIRRIIAQAPDHLLPHGLLCIECDYRQVDAVMLLFHQYGFSEVTYEHDLAHLQRVVRGGVACMKN